MKFYYGAWQTGENEGWMTVSRRAVLSPIGRQTHVEITLTWYGTLVGGNLASRASAIDAAMTIENQDCGLVGGSVSHQLIASTLIGGVKAQLIFPGKSTDGVWGSGTEFANMLSYKIIVSGQELLNRHNIFSWQETLRGLGTTGPRVVWQTSLAGTPQKQITANYTTHRVIQTGQNMGTTGYVLAPDPIWPENIKPELTQFQLGTPKNFNKQFNLLWPTSWTYVYESDTYMEGYSALPDL